MGSVNLHFIVYDVKNHPHINFDVVTNYGLYSMTSIYRPLFDVLFLSSDFEDLRLRGISY